MNSFLPQLQILPAAQQELWHELSCIPNEFILYGGTAIALQLGHRISIDFDFFCFAEFDPERLLHKIPLLVEADILQLEENTLTCSLNRNGLVQISFFGLPKLHQVYSALKLENPNLKVASLLDLFGMKVMVVQKRAQLKDYLDIISLIKSGLTLSQGLAVSQIIHGKMFNPQIALKALTYFEDGDVKLLDSEDRNFLMRKVKEVDLDNLPNIELRCEGN